VRPHFAAAIALICVLTAAETRAQRQMERLGRGTVAVRHDATTVYIGWRLLGTDPDEIAFNVYRATDGGPPVKLNARPIADSMNFVDRSAVIEKTHGYFVEPAGDGGRARGEGKDRPQDSTRTRAPSPLATVAANAPPRPYLSIPLKTLPGHTPNDVSVGDLDGDGEYEIVLKQEMQPRDNSQRGTTGETKLEAYRLDGTLLWRINLGKNIREGAHYTPFLAYDLDGDGKAEIVCRTADGTVDGAGKILGDPQADHRNAAGYVLSGPEYLTVFEGATGKALATVDYLPSRGRVADWGDDYGNRVDRFLACVAYVDGVRPSVVFCRGYYTRTVLVAWNWRRPETSDVGGPDSSPIRAAQRQDAPHRTPRPSHASGTPIGKLSVPPPKDDSTPVLSRVWTFDSDDGTPGNRAYRGQGNHNLAVGDVDDDGRDEILYGACCIDHDGKGLYSTGLGHGDAMHLSDIDPDRPGLEVFGIHEKPRHPNGAELHDARTGKVLWGKQSADVGRGVAMDIDPRHRGYEMWASGPGLDGLWNAKGEKISDRKPRSCNFGVWWDGDLLRELLDRTTISKWDWTTGTETVLLSARDCASNNSTKANPCLCADILGDWREEVLWRTADNRELRIYTTTIPTQHRLCTLMHDPQYRLSVAWQNVGYNQPPQPGFYLGDGLKRPPRVKIVCP